ncbi:MAG: hypothetical protein V1779_16090 [bacterium]
MTSIFIFSLLTCSREEEEKNPNSQRIISKEDELSKHISSQHFNYFMSENDNVDTVLQEKYFSWLIKKLQINVTEKINFYKFRDRKHIKNVTGFEINGFAELGTLNIYGVWPCDFHETTHALVTGYVGRSPELFNEGIAVAHQTTLKNDELVVGVAGGDFNLMAKYQLKHNKIPDLDTFLTLRSIFDVGEFVGYPVSGSFVSFLIETYGITELKDFIRSTPYGSDLKTIYGNFNQVYNTNMKNVWEDWKQFLNKYEPAIDVDKYYQDWYDKLMKK